MFWGEIHRLTGSTGDPSLLLQNSEQLVGFTNRTGRVCRLLFAPGGSVSRGVLEALSLFWTPYPLLDIDGLVFFDLSLNDVGDNSTSVGLISMFLNAGLGGLGNAADDAEEAAVGVVGVGAAFSWCSTCSAALPAVPAVAKVVVVEPEAICLVICRDSENKHMPK